MLRTLMQDRLQERYDKRAAENADAIAARQQTMADEAAVQKILDEVAAGGDPSSAATRISARTGRKVDPISLEGVRPEPRRRMAPTAASIAGAKTPEDVPTDESIAFDATAQGLALPDFAYEGVEPTTWADRADPFERTGSVSRELGQQAGAKRRSLMAKPSKQVTVQKPDGTEEVQFVSDYGGPVTTKPNAATQGQIAATEEGAKQKGLLGDTALQTLKGQTEARLFNLVEGLTRQAKINTASAVAGATERAKLAPDIVAGEVSRARSIAEGSKQPTEAERRAATNWTPLINAHAQASELEAKGARIGTGDFTRTEYGILNQWVDPQTQQYLQSGRDFVSTLGLIRSGTTVRPDERDTLVAAMYGLTGDDDKTLRQKQNSREVLLASMQAMVGRGGDEAGRILAEAINRKQIPASVLSTLQFDNEDIKKSLLANLKGIPQFDAQGRPIGVQQ